MVIRLASHINEFYLQLLSTPLKWKYTHQITYPLVPEGMMVIARIFFEHKSAPSRTEQHYFPPRVLSTEFILIIVQVFADKYIESEAILQTN